MNKLLPIYRFGWAFLLAWVFCVFYTQVVEGYTGSTVLSEASLSLGLRLFFMGLPVLFSVLTLLFIVRLEKRLGSPIDNPKMLWIAPLITAASCPLLFIQTGDVALTMVMFAIGALLTGIGSGLMWVMWGEYYAKISQEDVEFLAPVSAVVAAILLLLISAMSGWLTLVIVTSFPLVSGFCLFLSWRDARELHVTTAEYSGASEQQVFKDTRAFAIAQPWTALRLMGRAGIGIVIACLFVCLLGSFWQSGQEEAVLFQIVIIASILFMSAVAFVSAQGPQRISISFLFRWMCPFLVLGFVAIILWGTSGGSFVAYMISTAARFSFCLITQMYFAHFANDGRTTAVQAYGFGWIFVHLGDFLGVLCIVFLAPALATGALVDYQVAAVSIAVLTILTMLILNKLEKPAAKKRPRDINEPQLLELTERSPDQALMGNEERRAGTSGKHEKPENTEESLRDITNHAVEEAPSADDFARRLQAIAQSNKLTPRELEVFELLARGRSVPFIRDALVISRDTAATHVKHIYTKLDVHSRQELIDLTVEAEGIPEANK